MPDFGMAHDNSSKESQEQIGIEDKVFVKDGEKCWFVKLKEVRFFETYSNYSRIYFKKEKPLVNKSLNYLQARWIPKNIFGPIGSLSLTWPSSFLDHIQLSSGVLFFRGS